MTPPPTTPSPWYQTTDCPGVTARCGLVEDAPRPVPARAPAPSPAPARDCGGSSPSRAAAPTRRLARDEVHAARHQPVALEVRGVAHRDACRSRGRGRRRRAAGPLARPRPLRWPIVKPAMPAVRARARARCRRRSRPGRNTVGRPAAQEAAIVVVGHEADLLALGLVGGHQAEPARVLAHLVLGSSPTGNRAAASCACVSGHRKSVWSLRGSRAAPQQQRARRRIAGDARVVAGRHGRGVPRPRAREQRAEL